VIELASDARFARDLAAGGVFVPGCGLPLAEECDVLVCGANRELLLPARVVYVDEYRGAGLELVGFSPEMKEQLAALEPVVRPELDVIEEPVVLDSPVDRATIDEPPPEDDTGYVPAESVAVIDVEALAEASEDDLAISVADRDSSSQDGAAPTARTAAAAITAARHAPEPDAAATLALDADLLARTATVDADPLTRTSTIDAYLLARTPTIDASAYTGHDADMLARTATVDIGAYADAADDAYAVSRTATIDADTYADANALDGDPGDGDGEPDAAPRVARTISRNVQERLRGLSLAAQQKIAANGELHERIVLERLYGKNVWETLLRNPRLTAPEVARIARYGALPRVLLEVIVGNNTWLQVGEVRRALLANPRLALDQIVKVLRLTPKHELKLATTQTAYPYAVRNAAKQLITRGE